MDKKQVPPKSKDNLELDDSDLKQAESEAPHLTLNPSASFDISMFENDDLSLPKGKFIRRHLFCSDVENENLRVLARGSEDDPTVHRPGDQLDDALPPLSLGYIEQRVQRRGQEDHYASARYQGTLGKSIWFKIGSNLR
jgi:hypothetical protein